MLTQRWEVAHLTANVVKHQAWKYQKMAWVPVVLLTFKLLVFGTGMYFAIKWHHDQGKKDREKEK